MYDHIVAKGFCHYRRMTHKWEPGPKFGSLLLRADDRHKAGIVVVSKLQSDVSYLSRCG